MSTSIIEAITDYFKDCPLLEDGAFRVDALGNEPVEYMIETGIFEPVLMRYINGDTLRQYQFNFSSREYYSMDRVQNIKNSEFYENFATWIEEQNAARRFPDLPLGCRPQGVEILSSGYVFEGSIQNARYQIQLRLVYKKEVIRNAG